MITVKRITPIFKIIIYRDLVSGYSFDIHEIFMEYLKKNLFCDQDTITKAKQLIIRKFNSNTLKTIKRIKASGLAPVGHQWVTNVTEIW